MTKGAISLCNRTLRSQHSSDRAIANRRGLPRPFVFGTIGFKFRKLTLLARNRRIAAIPRFIVVQQQTPRP